MTILEALRYYTDAVHAQQSARGYQGTTFEFVEYIASLDAEVIRAEARFLETLNDYIDDRIEAATGARP